MFAWLRKTLGRGAHPDAGRIAAAYAAHDAEDWPRAAALLEALAPQHPDDAELHYRLGDSLYQVNRSREALAPLERAVQLDSKSARYLYKLGNVLKDLERPDEAMERYHRALQLEPGHPQALNNAGSILELQDRLEEALAYYRRAVAADPKLVPARSNLAVLLHRLERYAEAAEAYEPLVRMQPDSFRDWCNLGNAYQGMDRYEDALRCYQRALALQPASADAHYSSGIALLNLEKYAEAEVAARRAAEIAPGFAPGWANLGATLEAQKRYDDAISAYQRGLEVDPAMPELLNNMGAAYKHKGALEQALQCFERAVAIAPDNVMARTNLASLRFSLGFIDTAIADLRDTLRLDRGNMHTWRNLLMTLLYKNVSNRELFEEHLAFARHCTPRGQAPAGRQTGLPSNRRLRIGYVSSDLRRHPVGFNLVPVIEHHDRDAFDIRIYSAVRQSDDITRWFRERADGWHSIASLSDAAAAELVSKDDIDILVLLAGRFDENRPLLATYRPAPVQVSMHDPATSGLAEMDYLIADRGLVPRHTGERFTERVACLPTFYLHPPVKHASSGTPPPLLRSGSVTFGSFNNPAKINEDVVAVWAQVLRRIPKSRLLLRYMGMFEIASVRQRYLDLFLRHGIREDQLILPAVPRDGREQHLARYQEIDIALDPFPFTGSTTTFEALCMGVPVVTLEGERMVARWSLAMMRKVGLSHLVARGAEDYVNIAERLAAAPDELVRLRGELPARVARSPLCDEKSRTRQLERLYRCMWARYAAPRPPAASRQP